jgi:hypothetical protein
MTASKSWLFLEPIYFRFGLLFSGAAMEGESRSAFLNLLSLMKRLEPDLCKELVHVFAHGVVVIVT